VIGPTLDDVRRALALQDFDPQAAQRRMAPRNRPLQRPTSQAGVARQGGVLLLVYPHRDALHLVLTRRTDTVAVHRGQVSLPGGALEPDETPLQATLREAHEELAIDPARLTVLGQLASLYIPPTDFEIHPFVACAGERPAFRPDPVEVAEVLELSLPALLDEATKRLERWMVAGAETDVPFYQVGSYKVWGATAIVLSEFEERLRGVLNE
jgi:8-oxo-dGTP pyrophosphatase MutT (NUDIX family)